MKVISPYHYTYPGRRIFFPQKEIYMVPYKISHTTEKFSFKILNYIEN